LREHESNTRADAGSRNPGAASLQAPESAWHEAGRDIIVVGASMGGVKALGRLLGRLPADLPASVFVVLHTADHDPDLLAQVLGNRSSLPVVRAVEGDPFVPRHVYVAPPDRHLIIGHDHVHVRRGPRENGARPAIDPLFRSAAANCTTRVIGVVLTGLLNDGTAGLRAIKRCGGLAVVQDPSDAACDQMPRSAIRHVSVDHVLPLDEIAPALAALALERRPPPGEVPDDIRAEALIAAQELRDMEHTGPLSPITCPDCHGTLREIIDGDLVRYRCHTGHAYTLASLGAMQADAWERALYEAYRAQQERSMLLRRMAEGGGAELLQQRAESYEEGAELLRRLIAHHNTSGELVADRKT
jgi:two-component system, chemotaxis family, protein-glutamate methylesterase/glutaminase